MGADICGIVDIIYEDDFFGVCGNLGVIICIWIIMDVCGNSDEQDQIIIIEDMILFVFICLDNIMVSNDEGDCGVIVIFVVEVNDNCGFVMVNYSVVLGSFFEVGEIMVEVSGFDVCFNFVMNCIFFVMVNDIELFVFVCLDMEVIIEFDGIFEVLIEEVIDLNVSFDNCELGMVEIEIMVIFCDEVGSVVFVEVNFLDVVGNIVSCIVMLMVNIGDVLFEFWESVDIGESMSGNIYVFNFCGEQFFIILIV